MPLKKGSSKKTIRSNVKEMSSHPSAKTVKAARTYARRTGKPLKAALAVIATAAAHSSARRSKRKKK